MLHQQPSFKKLQSCGWWYKYGPGPVAQNWLHFFKPLRDHFQSSLHLLDPWKPSKCWKVTLPSLWMGVPFWEIMSNLSRRTTWIIWMLLKVLDDLLSTSLIVFHCHMFLVMNVGPNKFTEFFSWYHQIQQSQSSNAKTPQEPPRNSGWWLKLPPLKNMSSSRWDD